MPQSSADHGLVRSPTMTLTGLGADLRAVFTTGGKAARDALGRRLLAVVTMIIGAAAGAALALRVSPVFALALATALLAVVAAGAAIAARRSAPWRTPPALAKP